MRVVRSAVHTWPPVECRPKKKIVPDARYQCTGSISSKVTIITMYSRSVREKPGEFRKRRSSSSSTKLVF